MAIVKHPTLAKILKTNDPIDSSATLKAIQKQKCENSLANFIRYAWPIIEPGQPYIHNWHLTYICKHLEAISEGVVLDDGTAYNRLLINVPPGLTKSLIVGVFFPAWEWGPRNMPHMRYVCAAHQQDLAVRDGLRMRRLIQSEWYQGLWGDRVVLTGDQNQKCLVRGTQITMADGSLKSIEDVKRGEFVLSYDVDSRKIVRDEVVNVWTNGIKPVRKLRLSDGTSISITHNHRLYGWNDFAYGADMAVGDPIAVVQWAHPQIKPIPKDDAFLLALWLAEGAKTNSSYSFATTSPSILARVDMIASKNDWKLKKYQTCSYTLTRRLKKGLSALDVIKKYLGSENTYGSRSKMTRPKVDTIRIPPAIFTADDEAVKEFISTYIACDGCVYNKKNHGVNIHSASEMIIRDFAALLKRFDVQSNILSQRAFANTNGVKKEGKRAWRVCVHSHANFKKLKGLYLYDKDSNFRDLLAWADLPKRHSGSRCPTIPPSPLWDNRWITLPTAINCGDADVINKITSGLSWRQITEIEEISACETWHLETKNTHLFFAEGILSHNTKFENTATGFRQAVAAGSITGARAGRVIVDDPISVDGSMSEAIRNSTNTWFLEAVPTRLDNPKTSAIIVIMQRLHEEDVSGIILEKNLGYDYIMLPMRFDPARAMPTLLGYEDPRTEEGELLFPERFPLEVVDQLEESLGPYGTAGQLQQSPEPRGGGIIKRDWWIKWDEDVYPPLDFVCASLDTAYTEKTENDMSALTVWGIFSQDVVAQPTRTVSRAGTLYDYSMEHGRKYAEQHPKVILTTAWAERLELHALVTKVAKTCKDMKVDLLLIEGKASGISVAQEIQRLYNRENWGVQLINPGAMDKIARLYSVQHLFSEGMIYAPDRSWADMVITQCAQFPKAKFDDLVDSVSMSLSHLRKTGMLVRSAEHLENINEAMRHKPTPPPIYDV